MHNASPSDTKSHQSEPVPQTVGDRELEPVQVLREYEHNDYPARTAESSYRLLYTVQVEDGPICFDLVRECNERRLLGRVNSDCPKRYQILQPGSDEFRAT